MVITCGECGGTIKDQEQVVAIVKAINNQLPSKVAFSISKPTQCIGIFHEDCWENEFQGVND